MNSTKGQISAERTKISLRFVFLCFVIGALAATTGDFVHVMTNTTGYPADGPFPFLPFLPARMPIWVPFQFGIGVALMGVVHKLSSHLYQPRLAAVRNLAYAAPVGFVLLYAMTGIIKAGIGWQDLWLAGVTIALWWFADRTLPGIGFALLVAFAGTCAEMTLVSVGAFYYGPGVGNFIGVASWLPWLYMSASICVSLLVRHLD